MHKSSKFYHKQQELFLKNTTLKSKRTCQYIGIQSGEHTKTQNTHHEQTYSQSLLQSSLYNRSNENST